MDHKYLIALTFNEFQVLYSSSELRISRNRLVAIPIDKAGNPNFLARSGKEVLERAPHFDVEAEHSLLIGVINQLPDTQQIDIGSLSLKPISPDVFYLPLYAFESFHALTERGGRILAGRLDGYEIELKRPLFETDVLETIYEWSLRRSLAGGVALVELITGDKNFKIETSFAEQAIAALKKTHEGIQLPLNDGTFLDSLFCYERHQALPRSDIGYLMDLGLILKDCIRESSTLDSLEALRNLVKALDNPSTSLKTLVTLPDLDQALQGIQSSCEIQLPLPLALLFIRWKHLGLNSSDLDLVLMSSDVQDANKTRSPDDLKNVIWLFGLYWGVDRLVPDYYYRILGEYTFLLKKTKIDHKTINLSEIKMEKKKSSRARKTTIKKGSKAAEVQGDLPSKDNNYSDNKAEKPKEKQTIKTTEKEKKKPQGGAIPEDISKASNRGRQDDVEESVTVEKGDSRNKDSTNTQSRKSRKSDKQSIKQSQSENIAKDEATKNRSFDSSIPGSESSKPDLKEKMQVPPKENDKSPEFEFGRQKAEDNKVNDKGGS